MDVWVNRNCNWLLFCVYLWRWWAMEVVKNYELFLRYIALSNSFLTASAQVELSFVDTEEKTSWFLVVVSLSDSTIYTYALVTPEKMMWRRGMAKKKIPISTYIAKGWVSSYEKQRGSWILAMHVPCRLFFVPNFPGISITPAALTVCQHRQHTDESRFLSINSYKERIFVSKSKFVVDQGVILIEYTPI